jgi:hypothetical protein
MFTLLIKDFFVFFSKPCFEAFTKQQMPKNWRTRKKCLKIKIAEHDK